jgi:hypothetical protein
VAEQLENPQGPALLVFGVLFARLAALNFALILLKSTKSLNKVSGDFKDCFETPVCCGDVPRGED